MESQGGGEIKSCPASPILLFVENVWLFSLTGVSGMDVHGTAGCQNQDAIFGFPKSEETKCATGRLTAHYEKPAGKFCAFGNTSWGDQFSSTPSLRGRLKSVKSFSHEFD